MTMFSESLKNMLASNLDISKLSPEDHALYSRVQRLKELLPKEFYKCIGCPCFENDYPDECPKCSLYEQCTSGSPAYPMGCCPEECQEALRLCRDTKND